MVGSSQPVAGVGIGDRHGETAATDYDQNDVEHCVLPLRRDGSRYRASQTNMINAPPAATISCEMPRRCFSFLPSDDAGHPKGQCDGERHSQVNRQDHADLGDHLAERGKVLGRTRTLTTERDACGTRPWALKRAKGRFHGGGDWTRTAYEFDGGRALPI